MENDIVNNTILSENILQDHGEDVNPTVALVLTCLAIVLWCVLFVVVNNNGCCSCVVGSSLFFLLGSLVLFLIYSANLVYRSSFDYQGLMRVTDINFDIRIEESESCSTTTNSRTGTTTESCTSSYTSFYDAHFDVDWGYDWACPSNPRSCEATARGCSQKICSSARCSDKSKQRALEKVTICINDFLTNRWDDAMINYTAYDPMAGPSDDINWPNIVAFGNCDNCHAALDVASVETINSLRISGFSLLGASLAIFACLIFPLCLVVIARLYRDCTEACTECCRQSQPEKHNRRGKLNHERKQAASWNLQNTGHSSRKRQDQQIRLGVDKAMGTKSEHGMVGTALQNKEGKSKNPPALGVDDVIATRDEDDIFTTRSASTLYLDAVEKIESSPNTEPVMSQLNSPQSKDCDAHMQTEKYDDLESGLETQLGEHRSSAEPQFSEEAALEPSPMKARMQKAASILQEWRQETEADHTAMLRPAKK